MGKTNHTQTSGSKESALQHSFNGTWIFIIRRNQDQQRFHYLFGTRTTFISLQNSQVLFPMGRTLLVSEDYKHQISFHDFSWFVQLGWGPNTNHIEMEDVDNKTTDCYKSFHFSVFSFSTCSAWDWDYQQNEFIVYVWGKNQPLIPSAKKNPLGTKI